jgi:acetyl-CoA acetyltransferase family protein
MGHNADRLAKRLGIPRDEQDRYAEFSHTQAIAAIASGVLKNEITPVVVQGSDRAITTDNGPRADAVFSGLCKLRPAFYKKYGTVTAGNSSFLTDGAGAVLLMSDEKAKALGLRPKAYIRSYVFSAQNVWDELLLGPTFSIAKLLKKTGLELAEIGVLEIHEAFAAQMEANIRCLESDVFGREKLGYPSRVGMVDRSRLNVYGGSLSLGHPFGATGARLLGTCCNRLRESGEQFGIIAGCAAGAVGSAILVENAA